jgi:hypothetical protein
MRKSLNLILSFIILVGFIGFIYHEDLKLAYQNFCSDSFSIKRDNISTNTRSIVIAEKVDNVRHDSMTPSSFWEGMDAEITSHSPVANNFLLSCQNLIINFLLDKNYTNEIATIKQFPLPDILKPIINQLDEYNFVYLNNDEYHMVERIFPSKNSIFEIFFSVEKNTIFSKSKEQLRAEIISILPYFMENIFSKKIIQDF